MKSNPCLPANFPFQKENSIILLFFHKKIILPNFKKPTVI